MSSQVDVRVCDALDESVADELVQITAVREQVALHVADYGVCVSHAAHLSTETPTH